MIRTLISKLIPATLITGTLLAATTASAAALEERVHVVGNIAYGASGDYVFTETYYEGNPVYVLETDATFRLYRRQNGTWYIDFNELDEQWSGTIAIGPNAATPYDGLWDKSEQGAAPTDAIELSGTPYTSLTAGTYTLSDTLHNGKPVYQRQSGGYTFSVYQRSNGVWYLDFDALDDSWSGTLAHGHAAAEHPWHGTFNGAIVSPTTAVEIADAPYSSLTSGVYALSGESHNGKPVYQRQSSGYTFSVYQRSDGKWYLDFDALDDSWSGTLAHTSAAAEAPLEADWSLTISNPTE